MGAEIVNNCTQENKISQAKLNIEEILDAENHLIKEMQKKEFKEEYSSLIKKESPTYCVFVQNLIVKELQQQMANGLLQSFCLSMYVILSVG